MLNVAGIEACRRQNGKGKTVRAEEVRHLTPPLGVTHLDKSGAVEEINDDVLQPTHRKRERRILANGELNEVGVIT